MGSLISNGTLGAAAAPGFGDSFLKVGKGLRPEVSHMLVATTSASTPAITAPTVNTIFTRDRRGVCCPSGLAILCFSHAEGVQHPNFGVTSIRKVEWFHLLQGLERLLELRLTQLNVSNIFRTDARVPLRVLGG